MLFLFLIKWVQENSSSTGRFLINFCVIPVVLVRFLARARCKTFDDRRKGVAWNMHVIRVHHDKNSHTKVHWVVAQIPEQSSTTKMLLCVPLDRLTIYIGSLANLIHFNSRFAKQAGRHWKSPIMACHWEQIFWKESDTRYRSFGNPPDMTSQATEL